MKTAAKMKFGETMISIPMDGYDDDSVQTIRAFIDGIKGAMLDAGKHFSAEIVSTSNWHQYDTPAMMKVKDKMSDLFQDSYQNIHAHLRLAMAQIFHLELLLD